MLSDHLRRNAVYLADLDQSQQAARDAILANINNGTYGYEAPPCPTCFGTEFVQLAENDRYGLPYALVHCKACGLFQVSPRLTPKALEDFYAKHYRALYHGGISQASAYSPAAERRGLAALNHINHVQPILPGDRIVEIGCAAGAQLLPFKTAGCQVAGYDYDENITSLGAKTHDMDLKFGGLSTLADDIAVGAPRPTAILYIHVFEHLSDPREELRQLAEILGPDGLLYLEVPGMRQSLQTREIFPDVYFEIAHTYHFDRETLVALAEANGWSVLYVDDDVRAVLAPPDRPMNHVRHSLATLDAADKAQALLMTPDADPDQIVRLLLRGGASHAQANFRVGEYLFNHKKQGCLPYLRAASALDPTRGKFTFQLARAIIMFPEDDKATLLAILERAVAQLPNEPYPLFHLARSLATAGRHEEAIGRYASAIRLKKDVAFFHHWLGLSYKAIGFDKKATASFESAIQIDEKLTFAHYELGLACLRQGDNARALACFELAQQQRADPRFDKAAEDAHKAINAES